MRAQVTNDGDVLYIFPGFAGGDKERKGRVDKARMVEEVETGQRSERGEAVFTATPEVLQFEVPNDTSPYGQFVFIHRSTYLRHAPDCGENRL